MLSTVFSRSIVARRALRATRGMANSRAAFDWRDPLQLMDQLTDEEAMIQVRRVVSIAVKRAPSVISTMNFVVESRKRLLFREIAATDRTGESERHV